MDDVEEKDIERLGGLNRVLMESDFMMYFLGVVWLVIGVAFIFIDVNFSFASYIVSGSCMATSVLLDCRVIGGG